MQVVSQVRQTEAVRHRGDLEFRHLLAKMPAAAYTCDADGLITYFNERAVQLWGREPNLNDPVDRFCGSFKLFSIDGAPIPHDECWMALALRDGKAYDEQEIVIERPDGSRCLVLAYANPFLDERGELVGAVNVLYGSPTGLVATGNQLWSQDSAGVMGVAEAGDAFGFDLAAANFGNDPAADLAVGVPTEDLIGSSKVNVGSVNVLYGSSTGVTSTGNQSWTQDSAGIIGIAEVGDRFGLGLGFSSTSPG